MLRLSRLSDAPPPARELLEVADDGTLSGWRSQGPGIGRFGGSAPDIDGLRALIGAAVATPEPEIGRLSLDATIESLEADGRSARFSVHTTPDGPWGALLLAARSLLDDTLPSAPVATLALVIDEGRGLRLEHRGSDPVAVELGSAWAEMTRWRDGTPVGSSEARGIGLGRVEAGPGWSALIAMDVPAGEAGDLLTASAWFVAEDTGIYVPVVLTGRASTG